MARPSGFAASGSVIAPRSGYPGATALTSVSTAPVAAFASADCTMLLKRITGDVARPRRRASAVNASGSGRSPEIIRSAPSSRFAWPASAAFTRSAKNPTVPTLATASTSAAISTRNSPARQSRARSRNARRSVFMGAFARAGRLSHARSSPTKRPADSDSRLAQRDARVSVVRDQQQRGAVLAIEPEHEVGNLDAGGAIEIAGRLVGHQELGLARKGARDRDALLLAAGQLPRIVPHPLGETDARKPRARALAGFVHPRELERQHHVLERSQRGQQLERLEDEAQQPRTQRSARVLVLRRQRHAVDRHFARRRPVEPGQQTQQRRLAGAGRADDRHRSAGFDVERDVVEDGERCVAARDDLGERLGADQGFGHATGRSAARADLEDVRPQARVLKGAIANETPGYRSYRRSRRAALYRPGAAVRAR